MSAAKIYARLSKDEQGQTSLADQERECRIKATQLGCTSVQVFAEEAGTSGYKDVARPVFDALMASIKPGDTVIAWAIDRLTRKGIEQAGSILNRVEQAGARLVTVSDGIDTNMENAELPASVLAWAAKRYSQNLSRNVKRGKDTGAASGNWSGGPPWYGYQRNPGKWQGPIAIDDYESGILHEVRKRYVSGESMCGITKDLNQRGVGTITGSPWRQANLLRILTNPRYAGIRVHYDQRYPGNWPAIFTQAEHDELLIARETDERMRTWPKGPTGARTYLLTGYVCCGRCGGVMRGNARKGQRRYICHIQTQGCGKTYRMAEPLEHYVLECIVYRLDTPELSKMLAARVDSSKFSGLTTARNEAQAKVDRLVDAYQDGIITKQQLMQRKVATEAAQEAAETALQREMGKHTGLHIAAGQTVRDWLERATMAQKRRLIGLLVERVDVLPKTKGSTNGKILYNGKWRFSPDDLRIGWTV